MSSSRKNAESIARSVTIRVVLENMMLRRPLGFCGITRAAQQESKGGAVQDAAQDAMLNVSQEDGWRCAGFGFRIPSCNSVEKIGLGGRILPVASESDMGAG